MPVQGEVLEEKHLEATQFPPEGATEAQHTPPLSDPNEEQAHHFRPFNIAAGLAAVAVLAPAPFAAAANTVSDSRAGEGPTARASAMAWTRLGGDPLRANVNTRSKLAKLMYSKDARMAMARSGLSARDRTAIRREVGEDDFTRCRLTYGERFKAMAYSDPVRVHRNVIFRDPNYKGKGAPAWCINARVTVANGKNVRTIRSIRIEVPFKCGNVALKSVTTETKRSGGDSGGPQRGTAKPGNFNPMNPVIVINQGANVNHNVNNNSNTNNNNNENNNTNNNDNNNNNDNDNGGGGHPPKPVDEISGKVKPPRHLISMRMGKICVDELKSKLGRTVRGVKESFRAFRADDPAHLDNNPNTEPQGVGQFSGELTVEPGGANCLTYTAPYTDKPIKLIARAKITTGTDTVDATPHDYDFEAVPADEPGN